MDREVGSKRSAIWLLGDSNPAQWQSRLATPLDPRHPARHSIWTPILDALQEHVYRGARLRLDTSNLYIRNAVEDPHTKPRGTSRSWSPALDGGSERLAADLRAHRPMFLLAFGAFAFEFARRALGENPARAFSSWGARTMGEEFRQRASTFMADRVNLLPLLHITIARGKFIESHNYFTAAGGANYFQEAGKALGDLLLTPRTTGDFWIQ